MHVCYCPWRRRKGDGDCAKAQLTLERESVMVGRVAIDAQCAGLNSL